MRIEFDPTNPTEAAAVRAMLTALTPRPTAGDLGIVMHEAPTDDAWHNGTTYTPRPVELPSDATVTREAITNTDEITDPNGEVRDSNGEPHDPRIHSTPPKLNADGTWRAKRGVKAEEIAAVRAERDTVREPATTDEADVPAQEQPAVTAPPAPPAPSGQSEAPLAPAASPAPIETPEPVQTSTSATSPSFLDVMKAITAAQKDGKIDTAKVKELCAAVGAGESTMGLNGPDNGDKRVGFMALLATETEGK